MLTGTPYLVFLSVPPPDGLAESGPNLTLSSYNEHNEGIENMTPKNDLRIGLISFYFCLPGVKMLSAYLREQGFTTSIIYVNLERSYDSTYHFSQELKQNLVECCRTFDVIGLSVFTCNFFMAAELTTYLKQAGQPLIVWGGIHPTIAPESCLEYADAVCLGEGEEAFANFLTRFQHGQNYVTTPGFWIRHKGEIVKNVLEPPPADISSFPVPDISYKGHYIRDEQKIVPLDLNRLQKEFSMATMQDQSGHTYTMYQTVFSRGCPHVCTFCCNNKLNSMFGKRRKIIRIRGLDSIFTEIKFVRGLIPNVGFIGIPDDNFLGQSIEFLKTFAARWQEEVKLPFKIDGSVPFISPDRLEPLLEAGLTRIQIGIQTGSDRTNKEVYRRPIKAEHVLQAANILNRYKDRLIPAYDFIFDNPYENFEDRLQTAQLLQKTPRPYALSVFSLTFYPGTELYQHAQQDKYISDPEKQIFQVL